MIVCFVVGGTLAFGPILVSGILTLLGSFERLSWVSLIGTSVLLLYWLVLTIVLYRRANVASSDGASPKPKKRFLIIGIAMTVCWICLFAATDVCSSLAEQFNAWRERYSSQLNVALKAGQILNVFATGILVTLVVRRNK